MILFLFKYTKFKTDQKFLVFQRIPSRLQNCKRNKDELDIL